MELEEATTLVQNLHSYEQQLEEVNQLLLDDPENEELQAIFENLSEVRGLLAHCSSTESRDAVAPNRCPSPCQAVQVIQLTRDLCQAEAHSAQEAQPGQGQHDQPSSPAAAPVASAAPQGAAASASERTGPSLLPPQVAEQIRLAQQRAALAGQGPAAWAIGAKCRAVYSGDGNWCAKSSTVCAVPCRSGLVV